MIDAVFITGTLSSNFISLGTLIALVVGTITIGLVSLLGLGFGIRKLAFYITGEGDFRAAMKRANNAHRRFKGTLKF